MAEMSMAWRDWRATAATSLATGVVVAAVVAHATRAPRVTSYSAASDLLAVTGLVAAVLLLVAGGVAVAGRSGVGGLLLLLAVTWAAPVLVGWEAGAPALRAVAAIAATLAVPVLLHLAVLAQRPLADRGTVPVVVAGYVLVGGLGLVTGLVHNPFQDRDSWSNYSNFAFVPVDPVVAEALQQGLLLATVAGSVVGAAVVVGRAVRARSWRGVGTWGPALAALAGEAAYAVVLLRQPMEMFTSAPGTTLYVLRATCLALLAAAVLWQVDARRRLRDRMAGLVADLAEGPPAGTFEESLRSALRDDSVVVRYWMRERGEYLDAAGRPSSDDAGPARAQVRVVRGSQPVAMVGYDPQRVDTLVLEQQLGAAARLAVDNERLRAESLAHLRDLVDSRRRVVAAADRQRQALERDLHDGAQQRLLAVLFELRMARREVDADSEPGRAAQLDAAVSAAGAALDELRDFAHGVFPAVLDESGLGQALWSLGDRAQVPVELEVDLGEVAADAAAERTAYLVARAAVDAAVDDLRLDVRRRDGWLVLAAAGVGTVDELHLADRVGAVGGRLRTAPGRLEAVIPCA